MSNEPVGRVDFNVPLIQSPNTHYWALNVGDCVRHRCLSARGVVRWIEPTGDTFAVGIALYPTGAFAMWAEQSPGDWLTDLFFACNAAPHGGDSRPHTDEAG